MEIFAKKQSYFLNKKSDSLRSVFLLSKSDEILCTFI